LNGPSPLLKPATSTARHPVSACPAASSPPRARLHVHISTSAPFVPLILHPLFLMSRDRFFTVRRSSPGEHAGFFPTGQGGRPVLPPLSDSLRFPGRFSQCNVVDHPAQPDPFTYTVPVPYTQPRSAPNRLSYDLDPQALYPDYSNSSSCQSLLFPSLTLLFLYSTPVPLCLSQL